MSASAQHDCVYGVSFIHPSERLFTLRDKNVFDGCIVSKKPRFNQTATDVLIRPECGISQCLGYIIRPRQFSLYRRAKSLEIIGL